MSQLAIASAMQTARQHHLAGRLAEAEIAYRGVLQRQPNHADAMHLLGVIAHQVGRHDVALELIRRSIELDPKSAPAYGNLASVLNELQRFDESIAACSRAIELMPGFAEAWSNLALALNKRGRFDEAIAAARKSLDANPNLATAHNILGITLRDQGKLEQAVATFENLLRLHPDFPEGYSNLAFTLVDQGKLEPAIAACKKAIALRPAMPQAYTNLGNAYKDQGLLDAALANFDRAFALAPGDATTASNRVYTMHFYPGFDAAAIYRECRKWNQNFAEPLKRGITPHANVADPNRRLRIGYISPDWIAHPVGRFMLPLLERHDRREVQTIVYSDVIVPDRMTATLRGLSDQWRDIAGQSDQSVANLIRQDGIDILVDLTMHMARNRLLVFARKPAPVQVTYLAYCSTTGLDAIDYRLTDPHLDPPAVSLVESPVVSRVEPPAVSLVESPAVSRVESPAVSRVEPPAAANPHYSEASIWLPRTYWCYRPGVDAPDVGALPAAQTGRVTFGCLNNFCKASDHALLAWLRILRQTPGSRLILHVREGSHRERLIDLVQREGIEADGVTLVGHLSGTEYFRLYNQIDIGLDPFPYGGGTTTCDAMWMGVPVVSLAGGLAVGRSGSSLLNNVGLQHLLGQSVDDYIRLSVDLAHDLPALSQLRAGLRDRMRQSPLMDEPRFAGDVESAFREMWRRYCARRI